MVKSLSFDLQPADVSLRPRNAAPASGRELARDFPEATSSRASFSPMKSATPRDMPPSRDLFIGGLPFDADEHSVRAVFEKFGTIAALDMSVWPACSLRLEEHRSAADLTLSCHVQAMYPKASRSCRLRMSKRPRVLCWRWRCACSL